MERPDKFYGTPDHRHLSRILFDYCVIVSEASIKLNGFERNYEHVDDRRVSLYKLCIRMFDD